ncbi:hypothetical protein ACFVYT_07045 [Streptomyces sp. NPDC058290]|uniref:hypothetical protein n=1 Tax=Streptomyces sp. NPDC058290 TaxID=3346426 RepID=UPI0036EEB8E9
MDFVTELARFAATGRLGAFHVGAHLHDLVAVQGEPDCSWPVHKGRRWPHWFHHGSLENVYCRCRLLHSMSVDTWRDALEIPGPGAGESYRGPVSVTESRLTAALADAGVAWRTEWSERLPEQRTLYAEPVPQTMVSFVFVARCCDTEPIAEDWLLHTVSSYALDHRECPAADPALPDDGYGA